jgi:tetratricopeptide (TPR) repeat protein
MQGSAEARNLALQRLATARQLVQASGDAVKLAHLWQMEGLVLYSLARYRASNDAYQQALQIHARLNRPIDQADLRLNLAMGHLNLSEYSKARQELALVSAEGRRSGQSRLLITALDLEAQIDARSGQPQAAISKLEQALSLARARQDKRQQLRILDSLAMVHLPLGQLAQVREIVEQR